MEEETVTAKRPGAITGICVIGLLGMVALGWLTLSGGLRDTPDWYPPYLAISAVVGLTAMVGLWLMRKWGFFTYAGLFAVNQIVLLSTGFWSIQSAIVPAIVVVVAYMSLDKMR